MREIIYSLPDQLLAAAGFMPEKRLPRAVKRVIVCGMGGSGISGDILSVLYPDLEIRCNKDYVIHGSPGKDTLVILISYSGNTEETLECHHRAFRSGAQLVAVTSGGKLWRRPAALRIRVPAGLPPRGALGYLFGALPLLMYRCGLVARDPRPGMKQVVDLLVRERNDLDRAGARFSRRLVGKAAVIYANSAAFGVVAERWRCQLNENSKIMCHTGVLPEMNHNEIVGFGRPVFLRKTAAVVLLKDPAAHPRNRLRIGILKEMIRGETGKIIEIEPQGRTLPQRVFWTIMLGDFLSYHLAVRTGVDPMPVKRIDYLKQKLKPANS